jgi:hypothetical protein
VSSLRQDYLTRLLKHVESQQVDRYGDFQEEYELYESKFVARVATKTWQTSLLIDVPQVSEHKFGHRVSEVHRR